MAVATATHKKTPHKHIALPLKYRITAQHTHACDIHLPASKSLSNRALIIAALAQSTHPIHNRAVCDDSDVLIGALNSNNSTIDIGAAGTAMRFLTAYYAIQEGRSVTITGSRRMQQRPIAPLVEALKQLGARIQYQQEVGFPPLHIEGCKLQGSSITMPGNISSQFISAILLIAPCLQQKLHITLQGEILSLPYIDMTIDIMRHFGASVTRNNNCIEILPKPYEPQPYHIEPDYSAASYWYEIAALNGCNYRLAHLPAMSSQGDAMIATYATLWGITTSFNNDWATITAGHTRAKEPLHFNLMGEPDLAQTIAVTCALRNQHFTIEGIGNLHIKESNRIEALISEAAKLGYIFTTPRPNCLAWNGERCDVHYPIVIDTHNDHRMAMAFAPAAICFDEIWIDNPQVVTKSYPHFWSDLQRAGFNITHNQNKENNPCL